MKDGDTLPGVANKFDVSVAEIKDWNNLTSDTLQAGQKLQLTIEKRSYQNYRATCAKSD